MAVQYTWRIAVPISAHFQRLTRFVVGRDFFISYTRRDAAPYAARLARTLGAKHTVYLDQLDTPQGLALPARLVRALQLSTALIVVGSPASILSTWVHRELELLPQRVAPSCSSTSTTHSRPRPGQSRRGRSSPGSTASRNRKLPSRRRTFLRMSSYGFATSLSTPNRRRACAGPSF
jgi:hypothetical protein